MKLQRAGRRVLTFAALAILIGVSAALAAPYVLAPRRPVPAPPDPLVANDLANRWRTDLDAGKAKISLSSHEATAILSQALAAWQAAQAESDGAGVRAPVALDQVRVEFSPGRVGLEGVLRLAGADVPAYFRGRPVGVSLQAEPRLEGERLRVAVTEAHVGRVPVSPGTLIALLRPRLALPPGVGLDPAQGAVELDTAALLAPTPFSLDKLTLEQDLMTIDLTRRKGRGSS